MKIHNDGMGESNILQNQFTAYLVTAVRRQKIQFLQNRSRNLRCEISLDMQKERKEFQFEQDLMPHMSLFDQLENNDLKRALAQLKNQELLVLTRKVLDERSFQEIADETGVGYKTVTSIYYRLLQKLRKELEGEVK